ncbi:ORF3 [Sapovirus rat/S4-82]|nr:ORF3 [Sapovirus rat/S4-82]
MSWFAGALSTAGFLGDLSGTISNIVAQQQQVALQREQLRQNQRALDLQRELGFRAQNLTAYLSTQAPVAQYEAARSLGYNHLEAQQMMGHREVVSGGVSVGPRTLLSNPYYNQTNHLSQAMVIPKQFREGTPGFTLSRWRSGSYDVTQPSAAFVPARGASDV